MAELTIREILEAVPKGTIRIPAFQRGFVWDADMVAFLMDSIYKGYPFGSLLLWRTKEKLNHERELGPFSLPDSDPDYPLDYVLDGQQRLTSLFGVFQHELEPTDEAGWTNIYFDFKADEDLQESQFIALNTGEFDAARHFPLNTLFQSVAYRQATSGLSDDEVIIIDDLQERFKEARIPYQQLTTEDRAKVAIVFERINRTGVPLDTLQLLTAWTWSEEFDLQAEFESLREDLAQFGFGGVGDDSNLILRCCAAVLAGDAAPRTLVELHGAEVRARFAEITNGLKGAIDFLKANVSVEKLTNLPFATILVPLTVFFSGEDGAQAKTTDEQRATLLRWFWRSCLSRRFSSGVLRHLKEDIYGMQNLRDNGDESIAEISVPPLDVFFSTNTFRINSVNTKTFVLILAQYNPRSFISGNRIGLANVLRDYNRSEFHHIYPRKYLTAQGVPVEEQGIFANFCFLSRTDNNQLGGEAPSEYRKKMPSDPSAVLEAALCPESIFEDDYSKFIEARVTLLVTEAEKLIN
ncbi:MAG: hypothetical protein CMP07_07285 [Xanthomonadales bacterium]|nr:hypothetical protein [Xanthomonadales bacterium]|tara:strand:+ start:2031 stop:3599 length:1569 start_codon:yes stop_codon:yes gene_type:complete